MQPDLFERPAAPARNWVAVACAEHARRGREHLPLGFMQVCHGRLAPLRRLRTGDRVAYYAPSTRPGEIDGLRSWVSLGRVAPGSPYVFDMGGGFVPHRRDVRYDPRARETPITPLLDRLEFIEDRRHWGQRFRFGPFEIGDHDMRLIADAMGADLTALGF